MLLSTVKPADYPAVYALMKTRGFPQTPDTYHEAQPRLLASRSYAVWEADGRPRVVFVFGAPDDGIGFLDVVCSAEAQGQWASRGLMREVADIAFQRIGLRAVWVQVHNKVALKAALAAGFVPATPLDNDAPVLVMTPGIAHALLTRKGTPHGSHLRKS